MELGALVCSARSPECSRCPINTLCRARQFGIQEEIPPAARRPVTRTVAEATVVLKKKGKLLLVQRPPSGRWENLWEFPHGTLQPGETHEQAAQRLLQDLTGVNGTIGQELLTIKHSVTYHKITLVCFEAVYEKGRFASEFYQNGVWLKPSELAGLPVSAPQRLLADFLLSGDRQKSLF